MAFLFFFFSFLIIFFCIILTSFLSLSVISVSLYLHPPHHEDARQPG